MNKGEHAMRSLELCAGAGGQALGLEQAGFEHVALVENDAHCCNTLRANRPNWTVLEEDVRQFKREASSFRGLELVAGGLPCPPFSKAGKQLGHLDERNLFPDALEIIDSIRPKAVMIENVRGFLDAAFEDYRLELKKQLEAMKYKVEWRLLNASEFGVPQLRPRVIIVALEEALWPCFEWPEGHDGKPPSVGETLHELMAVNGWRGANTWRMQADGIAPTLVGGSKKHGGPDLGPTRAKKAWASMGIDGKTIAESAPDRNYVGMPRLTVEMVARLQGFPAEWVFTGRKTAAYRQVGNAFPPPVARAVAQKIRQALEMGQAHAARPNTAQAA